MRESLRFLKRSRNSSRQASHPSARKLDFRQVRPRNHEVAFKLRRELTSKAPALKAAIKGRT